VSLDSPFLHSEVAVNRIWKPVSASAVVVGLVTMLAGCGTDVPKDEILLAFSGDCQAYLEPCG
jgi:hypothetical protein